jgi:AcrR family transcriptional regulator
LPIKQICSIGKICTTLAPMTERSPVPSGPAPGLRERKKLATRHALSSAALQLALERGGIENVTIEDITARADVALRTFSNYFASKNEALAALGADRARRIGASLLERPDGEPLWEALTHAVLQHYEGTEQAFGREQMTALGRILQTPGMHGEYLKVNFEMQHALALAIAERTGTDIDTDMFPQILAGAVIAASQVATRRWYAADPPVPLRPLIELALRQLATACSRDTP